MKVFIDTNIMISASLFPGSVPDRAYRKAVSDPNKGLICNQVAEEMYRIYTKKFPKKISFLEAFLTEALLSMEIIVITENETNIEHKIRDNADRPLIRAAIHANCDIFLTGDKDFLSVKGEIDVIKIMNAAEFLEL